MSPSKCTWHNMNKLQGGKKKKSLTLQSKQLVLGWADTSWNNTWNDHLYSTDYWHEVTGRYRRNMQIQMLIQGTPKGFCLLYNNPQLWNNSWPISEQAASTVQSWQPTEDAEHILFEEGRSHTEPHPPILARMRPHRATHRWMLQSSPSHTARPVITHLPWSEGGFWSEGDTGLFPETLPNVVSCNKIRNKSVPASLI